MKIFNNFIIHHQSTTQKEEISANIRLLRFPLAVLVIILHADLLDTPYERLGIENLPGNYPFYEFITWFLGHFFGNCAVPVFFVISGFLMFYNIDDFTFDVYKSKIKRRLKSLLLPYFSWNIIYLFLFWIIGQKNIVLTTVPTLYDGNLSLWEFLYIAFVRPPVDGPLWFIRNLFVMSLFSCVLYIIIKKTKIVIPFVLLIVSLFHYNSFLMSFQWYMFGIFFAVYRFDFFAFCRKYIRLIIIICFIAAVSDVWAYYRIGGHVVADRLYLFRIMLVIALSSWTLERHNSWSNIKIFNNSSFTLYAYHAIPQQLMLAGLYKTLLPILGGAIYYLVVTLLTVLMGVGLGWFINRNDAIKMILNGR